jgi:SAM-dependent methyltransferase
VHGHSREEQTRLGDQAATLETLLHETVRYPPGSCVLEAGCGVGAQTVILMKNNPQTRFVSADISAEAVLRARDLTGKEGLERGCFVRADVGALPFPPHSFDHIFVCFVLEHLADPVATLGHLRGRIRPGGTITVIEGDHGSTLAHPQSPDADRVIRCLVELQAEDGGDACVGRRLYPLLREAGFDEIGVAALPVCVNAGTPRLIEGFTEQTFIAMIEGVRERALAAGMVTPEEWERGIAALRRTEEKDGTFTYTFFRAIAKEGGDRSGLSVD